MVRCAPPHIKHARDEFFVNLRGLWRLCRVAVEDAGAPVGAYTNLLISYEQSDRVIDDPRIKGVALTGSVDASLLANCNDFLRQCERVRYAGGAVDIDAVRALVDLLEVATAKTKAAAA